MNTLHKLFLMAFIGCTSSGVAAAPVSEAQCTALEDRYYESTMRDTPSQSYKELEESLTKLREAGKVSPSTSDRSVKVSIFSAQKAKFFSYEVNTLPSVLVLCWADFGAQRPDSFPPEQRALFQEKMRSSTQLLSELMTQNVGREAAAFTQFIAQHRNDDEFLWPALASEYATPEQLDFYARKTDPTLVNIALMNKNCGADTLTRIYRTHATPNRFLSILARHAHTPPDILREIFMQSPRPEHGLDSILARNSATPLDILQQLSDSQDEEVLMSLRHNPKLDCAMLQRMTQALTVKYPNNTSLKDVIPYLRSKLSCSN